MTVSDLIDLIQSSYKDGFTEGLHEGIRLEQLEQLEQFRQFEKF